MRNGAIIIALLASTGCSVEDNTPVDPTPGERLCSTSYTATGTFTLGALPPDRTVQSDNPDLDGAAGADGIADIQGCWPVGTWTIQLTQADNDCAPAPETPSEITFTVTRAETTATTDSFYEYDLVAPFNYTRCGEGSTGNCATLRISEGGGGACDGEIILYGEGGRDVFQISPVLGTRIVRLDQAPATSVLEGSAEFGRFEDNQLPAGDPPDTGGCSTGRRGGASLLALAFAALMVRPRSSARRGSVR